MTLSVSSGDDAGTRSARTIAQAAVMTAIVGAATAVYQVAADGDVMTLATVGTAAASGALTALASFVHRKIDKYLGKLESSG